MCCWAVCSSFTGTHAVIVRARVYMPLSPNPVHNYQDSLSIVIKTNTGHQTETKQVGLLILAT